MNGEINRAAELWQHWQLKEKMLLEVFGKGSIADNLNREKYDFLSKGIGRISGVSPDEKLVLGLIRRSVSKLEKQLYPHPVMRLLHRLKKLVIDRPLGVVRLRRLKAQNRESIVAAFDRIGLDAQVVNLDKKLEAESQQLDIELLSPYGPNNYSVKLDLERDVSGRYELSGFAALLKDPLNAENNRSYAFSSEMGINAREAVSLLQGRAVMKYGEAGPDGMGSKWLQLDFDGLGAGGKPVLREINGEHVFNIRQEVAKIAFVFDRPELADIKVVSGLEQGNQVAFRQVSGETVYLEASPLAGKIAIRDERQRMISLESVVKKREKSLEVKQEIKLTKTRSKQKQQGQALGIS